MDITQESCRFFVEMLASSTPAPGGGGAAALVGAIGTALGHMAGTISMMPGTAADPAYRRVDVDVETGKVSGLF